jgi:hypothetical protein
MKMSHGIVGAASITVDYLGIRNVVTSVSGKVKTLEHLRRYCVAMKSVNIMLESLRGFNGLQALLVVALIMLGAYLITQK